MGAPFAEPASGTPDLWANVRWFHISKMGWFEPYLTKSAHEGGIEARMRKLLRSMNYLLTPAEVKRAEGAIRALDIPLFCDLCESAWGGRPH